MNPMKIFLIVSMAVGGYAQTLSAGIIRISTKKAKHSIYGHTGQDPVYRSIPDSDSIFAIQGIGEVEFTLTDEIVDEILDLSNFDPGTSGDIGLIDLGLNDGYLLTLDQGNEDQLIRFGGGSFPAPSALPLFLLGLATSTQRRKRCE